MNMQGHALTGLPAPSGATDAARKGYVDTEIAGAIGGFGISDIAIDADKDWNRKNITNAGTVSGSTVTAGELRVEKVISQTGETFVVKSNEVSGTSWPGSTPLPLLTATIPANLQPGSKIRCWYSDRSPETWGRGIRVLVNDVEVFITSSTTRSFGC